MTIPVWAGVEAVRMGAMLLRQLIRLPSQSEMVIGLPQPIRLQVLVIVCCCVRGLRVFRAHQVQI